MAVSYASLSMGSWSFGQKKRGVLTSSKNFFSTFFGWRVETGGEIFGKSGCSWLWFEDQKVFKSSPASAENIQSCLEIFRMT